LIPNIFTSGFVFRFCDVASSGDGPEVYLAKFGNMLKNKKVEKAPFQIVGKL
jgi:hypothetical protein